MNGITRRTASRHTAHTPQVCTADRRRTFDTRARPRLVSRRHANYHVERSQKREERAAKPRTNGVIHVALRDVVRGSTVSTKAVNRERHLCRPSGDDYQAHRLPHTRASHERPYQTPRWMGDVGT
jgi:hypothetical protein